MELEELEAAWNAKADRFNRWCELGVDEIVAFAQEVEREACAKLVAQMGGSEELASRLARAMAQAIRARSNVQDNRPAQALSPAGALVGRRVMPRKD